MILDNQIDLSENIEETAIESHEGGFSGLFFVSGKKVKALPRLAVFSKWWNN